MTLALLPAPAPGPGFFSGRGFRPSRRRAGSSGRPAGDPRHAPRGQDAAGHLGFCLCRPWSPWPCPPWKPSTWPYRLRSSAIQACPGATASPCACPGLVPATTGYALHTEHGLEALAAADTVVVPGYLPLGDPGERVCAARRQAAGRGARVVSVCTGAFALAAAGLLDHRRAATHWQYAGELAARYPAVKVDADVLWVDEGPVLTSAGLTAGIDLCVQLVRNRPRSPCGLGAADPGPPVRRRDRPGPAPLAHRRPDPGSPVPAGGHRPAHRRRRCPLRPGHRLQPAAAPGT
jgi:putative intracellular protease/amidase